MGTTLYECPICKTHNPEDAKNCYKCGHWMLSTNYPAKKVVKASTAKIVWVVILSVIGGIVAFFALIIIIGLFLLSGNDSKATTNKSVKIQQETNYGGRQNPVPMGTSKKLSVKQYFALTRVGDNKYAAEEKRKEHIAFEVPTTGWGKLEIEHEYVDNTKNLALHLVVITAM